MRELIPGNCINCAAFGGGTFLQYIYDWYWFCLLLAKGHGQENGPNFYCSIIKCANATLSVPGRCEPTFDARLITSPCSFKSKAQQKNRWHQHLDSCQHQLNRGIDQLTLLSWSLIYSWAMIKGFVPTLEVSRKNVVLLGLFESVSYSERKDWKPLSYLAWFQCHEDLKWKSKIISKCRVVITLFL